jgi:hypothetical protein
LKLLGAGGGLYWDVFEALRTFEGLKRLRAFEGSDWPFIVNIGSFSANH